MTARRASSRRLSVPSVMKAAVVREPGAADALKNPNTTLLGSWPMIHAHDAATTYLSTGIVPCVVDAAHAARAMRPEQRRVGSGVRRD